MKKWSKNQPAWELRRQRRGCGRVQQPNSGWDEEPDDPSILKETKMLSYLKLQVTQALQKHACWSSARVGVDLWKRPNLPYPPPQSTSAHPPCQVNVTQVAKLWSNICILLQQLAWCCTTCWEDLSAWQIWHFQGDETEFGGQQSPSQSGSAHRIDDLKTFLSDLSPIIVYPCH